MDTNVKTLQGKALNMRKNIIKMLAEAGSGHPGGSLSATDILACLYFYEMNLSVEKAKDPNRDRFVLSKGHAAPVLYAALAEKGFFPEEEVLTLRKIGSRLQGHPSMAYLPGVEMSTGSLGQGFSAASGIALAGKLDNLDYRVYTLLGDGELQEGLVWEAAMFAGHYKLDNLLAIVDYNGLQIDGPITEVMSPEPITDKWKAFGWHTIVIDGHNYDEILAAFVEAKTTKGIPTVIIAKTIKGKGVSFMENQAGWHGSAPSKEQADQALAELV